MGYSPWGQQRVGHDQVTSTTTILICVAAIHVRLSSSWACSLPPQGSSEIISQKKHCFQNPSFSVCFGRNLLRHNAALGLSLLG